MSKTESTIEVFPVHMILEGNSIWLGWVPTEPMDYFVHAGDSVVWSFTHDGLLQNVPLGGSFIWGEPSLYNLDEALEGLRRNLILSSGLLIDLWNLFTDFSNTLSENKTSVFCSDFVGAYDALFADAEAANIVGVHRPRAGEKELQAIYSVMEKGKKMILDATIGNAPSARPH